MKKLFPLFAIVVATQAHMLLDATVIELLVNNSPNNVMISESKTAQPKKVLLKHNEQRQETFDLGRFGITITRQNPHTKAYTDEMLNLWMHNGNFEWNRTKEVDFIPTPAKLVSKKNLLLTINKDGSISLQ